MKVDIAIIGGGLAGLSLAIQLKNKMPDLDVLVIEKNRFPVREAAFKVGESTVEMGAHYYSKVLGLKQHLEDQQLFKLGLRYFFPSGNNSDISQRFEMGSAQLPTPVPSYQIDRGRFENYLYELNLAKGVTILDGHKVRDVAVSTVKAENHIITYAKDGKQHSVECRWVVDASGRFGLLKRKLHLAEPVRHSCSAAWFRINGEIDINSWSSDPRWQARSPMSERRFSTNHLMGKGYWVWLIPLASGLTSIGVVYDSSIHKSDDFKNFDLMLEWIKLHEPQLYMIIKHQKQDVVDFHWLNKYSYSCKQVYSSDRWYITGEAGVFADPFYSPGNDFIGMGNTYIVDLIYRDINNEDIESRTKQYNNTYLQYFNILLSHFEGHYINFGNPFLMTQKILWDTLCAFAVPYLLFFKDKFCDLSFMEEIGYEALSVYGELTRKVQKYFKESPIYKEEIHLENNYLNFSDLIHSRYYGGRIYKQLHKKLNDASLIDELCYNLNFMRKMAGDIVSGKKIIPDYYVNGDGNKQDLWRTSKQRVRLSVQNSWDKTRRRG